MESSRESAGLEEALKQILFSGTFDVFEIEPPDDHEFLSLQFNGNTSH